MSIIYKRNCNVCGEYYENQGRYFCSRKCFYANGISDKTKEKMSKAQTGENNGFYGKKHTDEAIAKMKGRKFSEAHKKKLREAKNGKHYPKMSEAQMGRIPWNQGMKGMGICKATSGSFKKGEHRSLNTEFKKGDKRITGENNPNWQGGKSFEPYGMEFNNELKDKIRKRDSYRCQECFRHQDELFDKVGRKYSLLVHHIDYNKKNNNSNNLISLCRSCHAQTNYKREDWVKYFQNLKPC